MPQLAAAPDLPATPADGLPPDRPASSGKYSSSRMPVGIAGAANIDTQDRIGRDWRCKDASPRRARTVPVALAIGNAFENGRHRMGLGVFSASRPGRQAACPSFSGIPEIGESRGRGGYFGGLCENLAGINLQRG